MPNWSYNTIAIQGKKEAVQELIDLGLKNSNLVPSGDIIKDFENLVQNGMVKTTVGDMLKDGGENEVCMDKWFSARTFFPMPDTFLLHDTTNSPNAYPAEVVKEQIEKYGAVGWYDYNCKTLGCKWNFSLNENEDASIVEVQDGIFRITFTCRTPWSMPLAWCGSMRNVAEGLRVFIKANEESSAYILCGEVDADGELDEYCDMDGEMSKQYGEWEKEREREEEKIKKDEKKMATIKKKVKKRLEDGDNEFDEETLTSWEIESLVDEVCGDFFDDTDILEKLDSEFVKMLDERI